jgi:hypothetical protein
VIITAAKLDTYNQECYQLHNTEILSFNSVTDNNIVKFVKSTAPHDPVVCAPLP